MRRLTVLLILIAAATGCGASEEERVRAAVDKTDRAWEDEDYETVCAMHTEAGRRELVRNSDNPGARGCADALVSDNLDEVDEGAFQTLEVGVILEITEVEIDGDRAVVRYSTGFAWRLRKVDGEWRLDAQR